jgi:HSP20 family protein
MATETKLPVTTKTSEPALAGEVWRPLELLRKDIDRLFDDFS